MKIGVALSGGGIRGVSHIGALNALLESEIIPYYISGCSAGSIVAGLFSIGYSPKEIGKIIKENVYNIVDIDYFGVVKSLFKFTEIRTRGLSGLLKGERLENLLKKYTNDVWLKDTLLPVGIPAVGVQDSTGYYFVSQKNNLMIDEKHTKYIDNTKLYEAIRASASFPALFAPKIMLYEKKHIWLMDGGIVDNLPIDVLRKMGADHIIGINLGYNGRIHKEVDSFLEIADQALSTIMYYNTKSKYSDLDRTTYIMNPKIWDVSLLEFSAIDECIERGYLEMKKHIPSIKKQWNI